MEWIRVLDADALSSGERQVVSVKDHKILLLEHENTIYAMLNTCPHMGVSLKNGRVTEEDDIVCPFHHSVFDLETGAVKAWAPWPPVLGKLLGAVRPESPLHVYPTKTESGGIWIGLGKDDAV
ncbi:MAG: Rieske (2Fe-2S) protein [Anaerolineae bacterium]|jgi:nitrite reductase/ring-hydroxylating ferredoxin subunit|nr:Rieske (2Fe-2S) protein [Anaerolineae bacterium]